MIDREPGSCSTGVGQTYFDSFPYSTFGPYSSDYHAQGSVIHDQCYYFLFHSLPDKCSNQRQQNIKIYRCHPFTKIYKIRALFLEFLNLRLCLLNSGARLLIELIQKIFPLFRQILKPRHFRQSTTLFCDYLFYYMISIIYLFSTVIIASVSQFRNARS